MDRSERALVRVSAELAASVIDSGRDLRPSLESAFVDCRPADVEEVLLQSYLFLGFPAVLDGFAAWRGLSASATKEARPLEPSEWLERGAEASARVYGDQIERLRTNVHALHPDLERWMIAEGYGKVLSRPGLTLRLRELCIVALIAVLSRPRQLYSHLRGALRVGATPDEVEEALSLCRAVSTAEAADVAAEAWRPLALAKGVSP